MAGRARSSALQNFGIFPEAAGKRGEVTDQAFFPKRFFNAISIDVRFFLYSPR